MKTTLFVRGALAALGFVVIQAAHAQQLRTRLEDAAEAKKKACFAGPIGSDQTDTFTGGKLKGDGGQRGRSIRIGKGQIAQLDGKFRGHVLTPKPAVWPRLASPESLTDA